MDDFITKYVQLMQFSESPANYHRWCAISMLGSIMGRRAFLPFGMSAYYPNMYVLILGNSGVRKSSAIKATKRVMSLAGYSRFAAARTSREKFLMDLQGIKDDEELMEDEELSWIDPNEPKEVYIVADEFMEFIGIKNINFITLLGTLWDYDEVLPYEDRLKNSKSIKIKDPTISLLGGMTPTNFAMTFPSEVMGQGFFSRILLIHGEASGKRYTIARPPDQGALDEVVSKLQAIALNCQGTITYTDEAFQILDDLYVNHSEAFHFNDSRFESYQTRRSTHLLKLCMICAFSRESKVISKEDVIYANTMLACAEKYMPLALGEFGKSANADVTHKIMSLLIQSSEPVSHEEIWAAVSIDLSKIGDLTTILGNLMHAGKIQPVSKPKLGYLPVLKQTQAKLPYVDWSLLTSEEQEKLK